jgi:hypothetical protein
MSDKMRRYMIAFCILLIFSVFHFALAAPVTIGEMLEVRSNAVDPPKGRIAAWEKRVGTDDEDNAWSTNEAHRNDNPAGNPEPNDEPYVYNSDDIEGYKSEDLLGPESPWDKEVMGSDGRGPDRYYNNPYESDDEDGGANPDHKDDVAKPNDNLKSDGEGEDGNGNYLVDDNGYDGDMDNDNDSNNDHSEQGSVENMSLGPEPGHPATPERPEHMPASDLEELFRLRPRNSFGIVGTPKRALQGIVDTKAYVSDSPSPNKSQIF